jgi:hypothetical protein
MNLAPFAPFAPFYLHRSTLNVFFPGGPRSAFPVLRWLRRNGANGANGATPPVAPTPWRASEEKAA